MSSFLVEYNVADLSSTFASLLTQNNPYYLDVADHSVPKRMDVIPKPEPLFDDLIPVAEEIVVSKQEVFEGIISDADHRFNAGFSVANAGCRWKDGNAPRIKVRGPSFVKDKKKVHSAPSLYKLINVDLVTNSTQDRIAHVASHIKLPAATIKRKPGTIDKLPRLIVINMQIPKAAPKFFGKADPDPGVNLLFYFEIKQDTYDTSIDPKHSSPSLHLLERFFEKLSQDEDIARRFKMIGTCFNIGELGIPSMFHSYNGKPVIVFKAGSLSRGLVDGKEDDMYMQVDVNVHDFAYVARKGLYTLQDDIPKMNFSCSFVLQGETPEELPEQVFGCAEMGNVNLDRACHVKFN